MSARVDHGARRLEIATRAIRLFSQVGYDNVTLLMIASATGVARTVLYRYFRSKREVFDAAILATTRAIMSDVRRELARKGSVTERLGMVAYGVTDVLFEKREFLTAIFDFVLAMVRKGEDMSGKIVDFTGGLKTAFRELVTEGLMRGEIKDEVDPERTAESLYAIMESCVLRIVLGKDKNSAAVKRNFAEAISALTSR